MNNISSRTTIDHADTAAEAVRALIHLTLGRGALGEPAELDRLVAELAVMAGRLPQLLHQLRDWLHAEQHAGRLRSDNNTDPARIVDRAAHKLAQAGHAADDLGSALDHAHQLLAHLAATEPDRTHKPKQSDASAGTASRDGRAETVATSAHFHGHQRAGLMAASGQKPMSLDKGTSRRTFLQRNGNDRSTNSLNRACQETHAGQRSLSRARSSPENRHRDPSHGHRTWPPPRTGTPISHTSR